MRVAFLGLGAIGAPMARKVAERFELTVWNRTRARADELAGTIGARVADTPADAVRGCGTIITCLPTSRDVASLLHGDAGLIAGIDPGALMIDCTSGDPAGARAIAARLAERGVAFIDAPVSGGVSGAERGALTVMCGGEASHVERARTVMETFGTKIVHCGPVGSGSALKAVNNALLAVCVWATGEGLATLAAAGVRADVALDVINGSSGRSNASQNLFPERVLTRAFPRTFRLALLDKDAGIAAEVAREHRVPSPMMQLASELFHVARAELGEEADHVEAVKLIERWAGVEIR